MDIKIYDINWDTDDEDVTLPKEVILHVSADDANIVDDDWLSDWLSDTFGWCHDGFAWQQDDDAA